jgi:formylglycine-generating enzyme required for sulfatase activity
MAAISDSWPPHHPFFFLHRMWRWSEDSARLAAMNNAALHLLDAIPWQTGLAGEFPGQRCRFRLGESGVEMILCWCERPPGGRFLMGSPPDEPERLSDEKQREVVIREGFWLAQHPVNQQQWQAIMGSNPSQRGKGDLCPVDSVNWHEATKFCNKTGLRLPSEAEWEYACRAGTTTPFGIGRGTYLNAQMANFDGNHPYGSGREAFKWLYRQRTVLQGSFPPNAWGFHDMHGQLWEWCEDEYSARARVLRGG